MSISGEIKPGIELGRLLGWLVFAWVLTIETWLGSSQTIIGNWGGPDMAGTAWTWWWTSEALASGVLPWESQAIFYPTGLYPIAQLNLVDALIAAPLIWTWDLVVAYKLMAVLMIASTAWAGERLCRWEGADRLSSVFGGMALATSTYIVLELWTGRMSQVWLMPLVLGMGLWRRLLADRLGRRGAVAAGLVSGICFLSYWYYGFFGCLAVLWMALLGWRSWNRERSIQLALGVGACGLLVLPALWVLMGDGADLPGMDVAMAPDGEVLSGREASRKWAEEFSLWPWWVVGGSWSSSSDVSLGWTWLLVGLAPLIATWRSRKLWLGVALIGIVLSLGPTMRGPDGSDLSSLPLPFLWLQDTVPFFYRMRWPYRAASIVLPALAVVAALNLTDLARELPKTKWVLATGAILGLGWEIDFYTGSRVGESTRYAVPGPAYEVVDGPVLLLPLKGADDSVRTALWMQIWHGQPISYGLGGHIDGHRPAAWEDWLESSAFLSALAQYEHAPPSRVEIVPEDVQALLDQGFRYVVVDARNFRATTDTMMVHIYSQVLQEAFGDPVTKDSRTRVWRIRALDAPVLLDPAPGSESVP